MLRYVEKNIALPCYVKKRRKKYSFASLCKKKEEKNIALPHYAKKKKKKHSFASLCKKKENKVKELAWKEIVGPRAIYNYPYNFQLFF